MAKNNKVDYNQKVLEVTDLKKHFYNGVGKNKLIVPAVDGLTFDVYKREVFGLVGESGCGKTTTGRTIIKLLNPTEGLVKLNGKGIGAGYKEHKREIKEIKLDAKNQMLLFDDKKRKTFEIQEKAKSDINYLNTEINNIKLNQKKELVEAAEPLKKHKDDVYSVKNNHELEVEKVLYDFNLKVKKIEKSAKNGAKLDYEREYEGLKIGLKRKTDGLKESAALNEDVIEKRIEELNMRYENLFSELTKKYETLIMENEKNIISKADSHSQIKTLKEEKQIRLAELKVKFKVDKAAVSDPDKVAVKSNIKKIIETNKNKINEIKEKISKIKEQAKIDIKGLPENIISTSKNPESMNKIREIMAIRDEKIAEKKQVIASLRTMNKSKEALADSLKMQMIFQDPISSLNPRMTVLEIVGEGLTIQGGYTKKQIKERVQETLELVGLSKEYAARYPHEFSGGQRQRIGVARALIMDPDFIIADEPISALDVSIRAQVINLLSDLKERLGLTILFIAHDLSVVRFFCDRIAVMYNGKIVELADSDELFANPTHPYTKSLLSSVPQPDPDYEKNRTRINYDPRMHDYRVDKPTLREIAPKHMIYANDKEFAILKEEYDKSNGKKIKTEGDLK